MASVAPAIPAPRGTWRRVTRSKPVGLRFNASKSLVCFGCTRDEEEQEKRQRKRERNRRTDPPTAPPPKPELNQSSRKSFGLHGSDELRTYCGRLDSRTLPLDLVCFEHLDRFLYCFLDRATIASSFFLVVLDSHDNLRKFSSPH